LILIEFKTADQLNLEQSIQILMTQVHQSQTKNNFYFPRLSIQFEMK